VLPRGLESARTLGTLQPNKKTTLNFNLLKKKLVGMGILDKTHGKNS